MSGLASTVDCGSPVVALLQLYVWLFSTKAGSYLLPESKIWESIIK